MQLPHPAQRAGERARDRAAAHGLSRPERIAWATVRQHRARTRCARDHARPRARSAHDAVTGDEQAARSPATLPPWSPPSACPPATASTCEQAIPAHSGLGSGTQLALALAAALRRLHGLPPDPRGDARPPRPRRAVGHRRRTVHRRRASCWTAGRGASDAPPPVLAGLPVPAAWRVLLLLDPAQAGSVRAARGRGVRARWRRCRTRPPHSSAGWR